MIKINFLLFFSGVKAVFCGHYHQNGGGLYRGVDQVVTTAVGAALGTDPSGLRVVCVYQDRIEHKYYPLEKIPQDPELKKN